MTTIGISPKLIWAVVAAVAAQVLADPLLELPAWADYVIQAVATAAAAYVAPPGNVAVNAEDISEATRNPESGYGLIEAVLAIFVLVLIVWLLTRIG